MAARNLLPGVLAHFSPRQQVKTGVVLTIRNEVSRDEIGGEEPGSQSQTFEKFHFKLTHIDIGFDILAPK